MPIRSSPTLHHRARSMCLLIVFATACTAPAAARGVEPAASPTTGNDVQSEADQPKRERKKRVATAAVYLLAGVALAGLAVLGLVIVWGRRLRLIARTPLPRQSQTDELWYLRPKKGIEAGDPAETPPSDADGNEAETP